MTTRGTHRKDPPRRGLAWARGAAALGLTIASGVITASPATASPQTVLAAKIAQAQQVVATIQAENLRADLLDEQFLQAKLAVRDAQQRIAAAEQGLAEGQARVAELHARLGARAAVLYMNAGSPDVLALDATSVTDLGSRAQYGAAAARRDVRLLDDVMLADQELTTLRADLEQQQASARARQRTLDKTSEQLTKTIARQHALLASINKDITGLVGVITLEHEIALERAARAKLALQLPNVAAPGVSPGLRPNIGVDPGILPSPPPGAAAAIEFARAHIGDPYVYAAAGPKEWDCSGLTMVAWAHGGVTMDHSAQDQYKLFPKVPLAQLQPGDLVFFGNPIHHVALYVGAGIMIEAPNTGAFVRYGSIFRDDLVLQGVRPTRPVASLRP